MTPEQKARVSIDALLVQADWHVCHRARVDERRVLIQMDAGSDKTFACLGFIYRLIKFTGDKRAQALRQSMTSEAFAG